MTEKLRFAGLPRTTVSSWPVERPTVCSLRSYWSDQNHGVSLAGGVRQQCPPVGQGIRGPLAGDHPAQHLLGLLPGPPGREHGDHPIEDLHVVGVDRDLPSYPGLEPIRGRLPEVGDLERNAATGFEGGSAGFFALVLSHTMQGTFGDPFRVVQTLPGVASVISLLI